MKLADLNLGKYQPMTLASLGPVPSPSAAAVTKRLQLLTADGQSATALEQEAVLGLDDRVEASFFDRFQLARTCVGRIHVLANNKRGWATGFLVGPGLVLTNHHVFADATSVGDSRIAFDYWCDVAGNRPTDPDEYDFRPDLFFISSEELDYALVQVAPTSAGGQSIASRRYLRLIRESGKAKKGEFVTILQHPDGKPLQVAVRENKVTRAEPQEPFIRYDADTAHGASGSPVFNDQFQVVALHSSGLIKRDAQGLYALATGKWTNDLAGLDETDVLWETNVGFRVSQISEDVLTQTRARWPARLAEIEAATRGGDVMSSSIKADRQTAGKPGSEPTIQEELMPAKQGPHIHQDQQTKLAQSSSLVIPLQLRVSLELPQGPQMDIAPQLVATPKAVARLEAEAWAMRMPVIHDNIEDREGFNTDFLESADPVPVPVPTTSGSKKLAPLLDGSGTELKYAHFSVWMHKERRLALYTAANVDWTARKKIVDGKKTTRDSLAGWPGEEFAELWCAESRLAAEHQLPDDFYSDDRGAFDKGHLVRRDDVCWGGSFEEIQMANGDTYHVTNCSPQVKAFNQGQYGEENWGDLESAIQSITKSEKEKACIFAGPVFGVGDRWFNGTDGDDAVRIQIPSKYWKIVVVKSDDGFDAFGFVLEQDVRKVTEKEFYVTQEWVAAWKPISEIKGLMRGWLDLSAIEAFDRHP